MNFIQIESVVLKEKNDEKERKPRHLNANHKLQTR